MNIAFIGAGKMASALAAGFIRSGCRPESICAYDPVPGARASFEKLTGARTVAAPGELRADCFVVAVKPQHLSGAFDGVNAAGALVISIVAGASMEKIRLLSGSRSVVRVMPNTPALVGAAAGAYAATGEVSTEQLAAVDELLKGCGKFFRLAESQLDAVTGLSGSGPAYVFLFIQALADGGVAAGLPRQAALELAVATVAGSARLVAETGMHPIALADQVMSPGGTTACGVMTLNRAAFQAACADAVIAAAAKSAELGKDR